MSDNTMVGGIPSGENPKKRYENSDNSTSTPLTGDASWTGSWFDALNFTSVSIQILTDKDSAANGFEIQFSDDGTNVGHKMVESIIRNSPKGIHRNFSLSGRYFRIKYTNGSSAQSSFVLTTITNKEEMNNGIPTKLFDVGNSHSSNLTGDEVFTGEWVDVSKYVQAIVQLNTDQDAATDGLVLQHSDDGLTVDHYHTFTTLANYPGGHHYASTLDSKYFRIVYTNGSVGTSNFKITSTLFSTASEEGHVHAIESNPTGDHQASVVKAIIAGKKPNDDYTNVQVTSSGNLKMSVEEYESTTNPWRNDLEGVGDVTIGTSEVEIAVTGTPTFGIRIQADNTNTGIIYIGKTGVANDGSNDFVRLESGDDVIIPYEDSSNALYAISDTVAQTINVGALL